MTWWLIRRIPDYSQLGTPSYSPWKNSRSVIRSSPPSTQRHVDILYFCIAINLHHSSMLWCGEWSTFPKASEDCALNHTWHWLNSTFLPLTKLKKCSNDPTFNPGMWSAFDLEERFFKEWRWSASACVELWHYRRQQMFPLSISPVLRAHKSPQLINNTWLFMWQCKLQRLKTL